MSKGVDEEFNWSVESNKFILPESKGFLRESHETNIIKGPVFI